ncbi:MAG: hypothetical protein FWG40_11130 [Peptococcaceae bacterium]|nr:hypothetical protein [Peptococcaceae bacterium]
MLITMPSLITHDLVGELGRISASIRSEPLDASHRLALARLRLVQGEYLKALQQFQLACQFDAELMPEAQLARMLVRAEQEREAVFDGKILPDLFKAAPVWLDKMISALREPAGKAAEMRREALAEAQPSAGTCCAFSARTALPIWSCPITAARLYIIHQREESFVCKSLIVSKESSVHLAIFSIGSSSRSIFLASSSCFVSNAFLLIPSSQPFFSASSKKISMAVVPILMTSSKITVFASIILFK